MLRVEVLDNLDINSDTFMLAHPKRL
jgi:hypothetical protein